MSWSLTSSCESSVRSTVVTRVSSPCFFEVRIGLSSGLDCFRLNDVDTSFYIQTEHRKKKSKKDNESELTLGLVAASLSARALRSISSSSSLVAGLRNYTNETSKNGKDSRFEVLSYHLEIPGS